MKRQHLSVSALMASVFTTLLVTWLGKSKAEAVTIGTITPKSTLTSLVFVEAGNIKIPGFDHVALAIDEQLYESLNINYGVTNHRKSFEIPFPVKVLNISRDQANQLKTQIDSKMNYGYQEIELFPPTFLPQYQKGLEEKFTCVGLIEWAAEASGFGQLGQGYIENSNEYINVDAFIIPTLTPSLLYWSIINPLFAHDALLHMLLDPADFILTDPLGRRFGYTQELGLIQEIPNVFYTGDNWAEQLALTNLLDGEYTLEVFGLDDEATVAFGNGNSGDYFSGYLAKGESRILKFNKSGTSSVSAPEPGSVLGLTVLGLFGGFLKKSRKAE
jgi:hypothetical protein